MAKFVNANSCFDCSLKTNLFCYMTDEQLAMVDENRSEVVFKPGETIIKKGGPLTHILCITKGMVKIYLEDNGNDKRILLGIAKPVQLIGGPGFLVDDRHYISVTAIEKTTACFVRAEDIKAIIRENSDFAIEIIKYLNTKFIKTHEKLMSLTHKQTHGKIADTLLYLSDYVYNNDVFETTLSRQDLADMSGMTKESAIRVLKEFVADGILTCGIHNFEILDKEKLKMISKTG